MWNDAVLPQPPHLVFLVVLEVALEPFDVAVAFERQNVSGDAVEEPAIVADDDGAAGKILQRAVSASILQFAFKAKNVINRFTS